MPLFLGHITALHLIETKGFETLSYADSITLNKCIASQAKMLDLSLSSLEYAPLPWDVLIQKTSEMRNWSRVKCHQIASDLPDHSFVEIAQDIFTASPELCFVQMTQHLTLAQTVALGCNLCGTFAKDPESKRLVEREPVMTPEALETCLHSCRYLRGLKKAKRALRWVLPNSASPMETTTALVYSLPNQWGGFGFRTPKLNHAIAVTDRAAEMIPQRHIKVDVYWEDHMWGLEYQGRENHSTDGDIAADIGRQLAAEAMHIELQMLTAHQLRNESQRIAIAKKTAAHLGVDLKLDSAFKELNRKLVAELLSSNAPQGNGNSTWRT